jgi:hypothetical protein
VGKGELRDYDEDRLSQRGTDWDPQRWEYGLRDGCSGPLGQEIMFSLGNSGRYTIIFGSGWRLNKVEWARRPMAIPCSQSIHNCVVSRQVLRIVSVCGSFHSFNCAGVNERSAGNPSDLTASKDPETFIRLMDLIMRIRFVRRYTVHVDFHTASFGFINHPEQRCIG